MNKTEITAQLFDADLALDTSGGLFRNKVITIGELVKLLDFEKLNIMP